MVNLVMTKVAFTSMGITDEVAQTEPYESYMDDNWTSTTVEFFRSDTKTIGHTVVI